MYRSSDSHSLSKSSSTLARGAACFNCKRRKVKCDGCKPICGPCAKSRGLYDDCEFPAGNVSHTQRLTEEINRLETRMQELEYSGSGSSSIPLLDPYSGRNSGASSRASRRSEGTDARYSSSPSVHGSAQLPFLSTVGMSQGPTPDVSNQLLANFYRSSSQTGFFLDIGRFHNSMAANLQQGHPSRPCTSLIYAAYLWGAHLSQSQMDEQAFLGVALRYVAKDLSSSHPQRTMHVLQAEILLSFYYLNCGKNVEGVYHANAAISLAIGAGIHRIRSSRTFSVSGSLGTAQSIPPAVDAIEEGERVNAFWTVVVLTNHWVTADSSNPFTFYDSPNFVVDTPWPLESYVYETLPLTSSDTIAKFLSGSSVEGFSSLALRAKASMLFKKSTFLSVQCSHDSSNVLRNPDLSHALESLDKLVEKFASSLPLLNRVDMTSSIRETAVVAHMLCQASMMRLHAPFCNGYSTSRGKCLSAAKGIAQITIYLKSEDIVHVDPIVAFLLFSAFDVILKEVYVQNAHSGEGNLWRDEQADQMLKSILACMSFFAKRSALFDTLFRKAQSGYAATVHPSR